MCSRSLIRLHKPRGRKSAKAMAIRPRPIRYQAPRSANSYWTTKNRIAPMIGPSNVPRPPTKTMNQVCRLLHTKNRLRLNEQSVGQRQCPSRAAAETCQHEEGELHGPDANAQGGCDLFVVPDGLKRDAGPVAQQEKEEQHQEQCEAQCQQ